MKKKIIYLLILFALSLVLLGICVTSMVSECINRLNGSYNEPYRGRFHWSEQLDGWSSDEVPVGTMEEHLRETEQYEINTDGMTVYAKEELIAYLEESRVHMTMPSGLTVPVSIQKSLLELHRDWPIEVIVREADIAEGMPRIGVVYKVQDHEGTVEYLHIMFTDAHGLTRKHLGIDGTLVENETNESGEIVLKRWNDELEYWRVDDGQSYYVTKEIVE